MQEVWKPVPGYEGHYKISNYGRVKSVPRYCKRGGGGLRKVPAKVLQGDMSTGRLTVPLSKNGVVRAFKVQHLVLLAFVGPRPDGKECCHKDGHRTNNRADNLYWGTPQQNEADKLRHGTHARGERNGNAKLTDEQVEQIRRSTKYQKDIAKEFGISQVWVSYIRTGKYRKYG